MEDKYNNTPNSYEIGPYLFYQSASERCPDHQIGQISVGDCLYRPVIARIVANREMPGKGCRTTREHSHDVYHLVLSSRGAVHIKHHGEVQRIPPGKMLVVSPGEPHCFMADHEECCYCAITFQYVEVSTGRLLNTPFQTLLETLAGRPLATSTPSMITLPDPYASQLHQDIWTMARSALDNDLRSAAGLQEFLLDCINWIEHETGGGHRAEDRLDAIHNYIQRTYREPLILDQLAERAAMSRRTFTRRFRTRFGVSPKQLQIKLRIDASCLMLKTTNMQIQEIAEEVGYLDLYQFTAAFKKRCGKPPTVFRNEE